MTVFRESSANFCWRFFSSHDDANLDKPISHKGICPFLTGILLEFGRRTGVLPRLTDPKHREVKEYIINLDRGPIDGQSARNIRNIVILAVLVGTIQ